MDNANQPHRVPAARHESLAASSGSGKVARAARAFWSIAFIAGVFTAFSIFYSFATPLFEGIDEGYHFNIINYIASHGALPDLNSRYISAMASSRAIVMELSDPDAISHEATQPPLYYMASALLVSGVNRSDFQSVFRTNYDFVNGIANFHPPAESIFPPANTYLAMRIVRLFSTLLGALTVLFTYGAVHQLFRRADIAALAAALTAFNPKFIHLSSVVTNDIAVACTATLTLWVAIRIAASHYPSLRPFVRHVFVLGVCVGLTALTKYSGLAMLAPAGLAILWVAVKERRHHTTLRLLAIGGIALIAGFLLVSGWLFVHNWLSYGNPLAWDQVQAANAFTRRPAALTPAQVIATIPALLQTYWGYFGNGIQFPPAVDIANVALLAIAAVGVVIALRRRLFPPEIAILLVAALGVIATFIEWMRLYTVTENSRLLAPMFVTTSALVSIGLLAWLPRHWWPRASGLITAGCLVWAGLTPWVALLPNYNPPRYLTPIQAQALPAAGRASFTNGIELVSALLHSNRVESGGAADLTLYWRATRPLTMTYDLVLQAIAPDGASLGRVTTAQFIGRQFVAADWQLDQVAEVNYRLPISAAHQTIAAIYAGWYEHRPPNALVRVAGSDAVSAPIAQIKVRASRPPDALPDNPLAAQFGDAINLEGYSVCHDTLKIFWRATGTPHKAYTVFAHALGKDGQLIGQSDSMPPTPTDLWDNGDQTLDARQVDHLQDAATLEVGLYEAGSGQRLSAAQPDSAPWPNDAVRIPLGAQKTCANP